MKVLISGGAGYIGSTICSALEDAGHTPVILDNLCRGRAEFTKGRLFYKADVADRNALEKILTEHPDITCAVHCAALIIVPESVTKPYDYYRENVAKSLEFFRNLNELGVKRVVFSSSASIYDNVPGFMVREDSPLKPNCPYARTKYMMEMVLQDMCRAYGFRGIALRYFNPIGADPKMRSGVHDPKPSHVVGKLVEVALGREPEFKVTGVNWPTRDGSGIRDYIHIWDLAQAHVKALLNFDTAFAQAGSPSDNYLVINLGTGKGSTVKEIVSAFEKVYGKILPKSETDPRPGDVAGAFANADTAKRLLGWTAEMTLEQGIADALRWGQTRKGILGYE